jgi:sulfite reductase alpha subunit-like flavoprotein
MHLEFTSKEFVLSENPEPLPYLPGDVALVFPCNKAEDVIRLEAILREGREWLEGEVNPLVTILPSLEAKEPFLPFHPLPALSMLPLRTLLERYLDVGGIPKPSFFLRLSELSEGNEEEKEKLREMGMLEGFDIYYSYCLQGKRGYSEAISEFPSVHSNLSIHHLVHLIPPIQPRSYSIASCPYSHPGQVHLCVSIVNQPVGRAGVRRHQGVCSTYLSQLEPTPLIEEGSSMREEGDSEDAYDLSSNSNNRNKDPWFGYRLWIKKGYLREHLQTRRNSSFCEDLVRRKMLLIGCGSGIAPLRSILW